MQIHVDQVTDVKTGPYGVSSKIIAGSDHYFVNDDATKYVGKTLELEVSEKTSKTGNKYKIAKILKVVESAAASNGNGHGHAISWFDYRAMAQAAHELAKELEPDQFDAGLSTIDRSTARAAILNTVMIAYSNGKVVVPTDDDMPF